MADFIKYSFAGGVFSPELHGRGDLEKFADGIGDALNWFVDYRGGAMTRAGTEFIGQLPPTKARFFNFRFNEAIANNYLLIFIPERLLFVQDGGFLLEGSKSADIANGQVTSSAHGYAAGDFVQYEGSNYVVANPTANTFDLRTVTDGAVSITASGVDVARLYALSTFYEESSLEGLQFEQRRDTVFISHESHWFRELVRNDATDWTLQELPIGAKVDSPASVDIADGGSGTASFTVAVTSVDEDGNEGVLEGVTSFTSMNDFTNTAGAPTYYWSPISGAASYNVYRSLVSPDSNVIGSETLGFIGSVKAPQITDVNIVPDFTRQPPTARNPFGRGVVYRIDVTNGGSGYTSASVDVSGGDGTDFSGHAIVARGEVVAVVIYNGGSEYNSSPTVTITGDGTGAAATAHATRRAGNNPSTSTFFLQALWAAGTQNNPIGLVSSRANAPLVYHDNGALGAAAPQDYSIDTSDLTPIRHLGVLGGSMMIFTGSGIWGLYLDEQTNYRARQQTENGCSIVPPLFINREALFVTADSSGVWSMSPTNLPDHLVDNDRSLYSAHLFGSRDPIIAWAFAKTPFRVVWAITRKGRLLSLTYVAEQNVYAWAPHRTEGFFRAVASVRENNNDRAYFAVERHTGLCIERMAERDHTSVEDVWAVDSGLETALPLPDAELEVIDNGDGTFALQTDADVFSEASVDSHVRVNGNRLTISQYVNARFVVADIDIGWEDDTPNISGGVNRFYPSGEWSLAEKVTSVSGLEHLRGQEVEIFADGRDRGTQTVTGSGTITLDFPSSKILVGLGYSGYLRTLPLIATDLVIEHRPKRIVAVAARVYASRDLGFGMPNGHVYYPKTRTSERVQEPTKLSYGIIEMPLLADWKTDGVVEFRKEGPMAASVLGVVFETEIGDDEN